MSMLRSTMIAAMNEAISIVSEAFPQFGQAKVRDHVLTAAAFQVLLLYAEREKCTNTESRVLFAFNDHPAGTTFDVASLASHMTAHGGLILNATEVRDACSELARRDLLTVTIAEDGSVLYSRP